MPAKTRTAPKTAALPDPLFDDLGDLLEDWRRSMRQRGLSPETLKNYLGCTGRMLAFLKANGMPHAADTVKREHLEAFIIDRLENVSEATAHKHYRAMKIFFNWLVAEDILVTVSPMTRMSPPKLREKQVPVIPLPHISKLLATCSTKEFYDMRDKALLLFMLDSGCRVGEIVGMKLTDYDPETRTVQVTGKGQRTRRVIASDTTTNEMRRYLRIRRRHHLAATSDAFWLGRYQFLGRPGIAQMLDRRCDAAGIPRVHPHQFRHTFAHNWQAAGGSENDLMSLAGWKSREMVSRYAASAASERAHVAHQSFSPVDRLFAKG